VFWVKVEFLRLEIKWISDYLRFFLMCRVIGCLILLKVESGIFYLVGFR
jgi:hypothetical protein